MNWFLKVYLNQRSTKAVPIFHCSKSSETTGRTLILMLSKYALILPNIIFVTRSLLDWWHFLTMSYKNLLNVMIIGNWSNYLLFSLFSWEEIVRVKLKSDLLAKYISLHDGWKELFTLWKLQSQFKMSIKEKRTLQDVCLFIVAVYVMLGWTLVGKVPNQAFFKDVKRVWNSWQWFPKRP